MSDPAWTAQNPLKQSDGILYIQAAGVTAAPGTADEIGHVTDFEHAAEPVTAEYNYLNYGSTANVLSAYTHSGSFSLVLAEGANTVRDRINTAIANKTRLKLTIQVGGATGEKTVLDRCIVGKSLSGSADGWTLECSYTADSYTHTNATAA